jgi:hypothetical protein
MASLRKWRVYHPALYFKQLNRRRGNAIMGIENLSHTIVPKSDQLNAEQLLGGSVVITVTNVSLAESIEQPLVINYQDDNGMPFKPCKTVRKILVFAWGEDGRQWIGKSMTLFCDSEVKYGGVKVGGIRVSHLSNIDKDLTVSLTATRGKKAAYTVMRLAAQQQQKQQTIPNKDYQQWALWAVDGGITTTESALQAALDNGLSLPTEQHKKAFLDAFNAELTK